MHQTLNEFIQKDAGKELPEVFPLSAWIAYIIIRIENQVWEFSSYLYAQISCQDYYVLARAWMLEPLESFDELLS